MTTQTRPSHPSRFSAFKAIILCLLAGLFSTAFAEDWDGSTSMPSSREINGVEYYVITSPSELAWFAYQVNNKSASKINAVLGNDIHFMDDDSTTSMVPWTAIGFTDSTIFDGVFDGAGYKIYGLYSKGAIFGYTGTNFVLRNFSIKKSDVITWVAFNYGTIENSTEENDGLGQVAGFAYQNNGTIRNCFANNYGVAYSNYGVIENSHAVGGLGEYSSSVSKGKFLEKTDGKNRAGISYNNYGVIRNCSFMPKEPIVTDNGHVAGITIQSDSNSVIENCEFRGVIKAYNKSTSAFWPRISGIVNYAYKNTRILNSRAVMDTVVVTGAGDCSIGGIVASAYGGYEGVEIAESFADVYIDSLLAPNVTYSNYSIHIGGIAGYASFAKISGTHANVKMGGGISIGNKNKVIAASVAGGATGLNETQPARVESSYGTMYSYKGASNYMLGGVVSEATYSQLSNSYYDKSIAVPDTMHAVQNLDGTSTSANVTGKTTAVMQSPAFVETLNTNAGLDDDSGIWQYCEGNYPILASEGTCEEFYSKYGLSSSSQSSSSSAEPGPSIAWDGSTSKPSSKEINGVEYYVITSPSELAWFAYQVNNKSASKINAVLGNDIHFMDDDSTTSMVPWTAIGFTDSTIFDGVFDGAGYKIYGLYSKGAIFGYTGTNFVLRNFSIKKSDVITWVAFNYGTIENSTEENDGLGQVAGFAYQNNGTIRNCFANNYGVAYSNYGVIENSHAVGGLGEYSSSVSKGKFLEKTDGKNRAGISYNNYGVIRNCSFMPKEPIVTDNGHVAGITIQSDSNSVIENCEFRGVIKAYNKSTSAFWPRISGIVNYAYKNTRILNSRAVMDTVVVTGAGDCSIGGIVASAYGGYEGVEIAESFADVYIDSLLAPNVTYSNYSIHIGGIAGYASFAKISGTHANVKMGGGISIGNKNKVIAASVAGGATGLNETQPARVESSYGTMYSYKGASNYMLGGVVSEATYSQLSNSYYDKSIAVPDTMHAVQNLDGTSTSANVLGKTTAVMQSPAFVETLNTNAGLDDDSGLWQYCEGNYPILVSEGTCEEFYSKYGMSSSSLSSSSSAESSSSTPVESSSSDVESSSSEIESSSSVPILSSSSEESSSSSVIASSSSDESSSSKAETSSSTKPELSSSSKANSSSSKGTDIAWNAMRPMFNLSVNGMTLTLSNTQGGVVRIFDALGHMVTAKPLASATTSITLQTPGNYIVRVNGISRSVTLK